MYLFIDQGVGDGAQHGRDTGNRVLSWVAASCLFPSASEDMFKHTTSPGISIEPRYKIVRRRHRGTREAHATIPY